MPSLYLSFLPDFSLEKKNVSKLVLTWEWEKGDEFHLFPKSRNLKRGPPGRHVMLSATDLLKSETLPGGVMWETGLILG